MLNVREPAMTPDQTVQILLVDDQPRNLEVLEVMLASSGYGFARAQSADEALLALLDQDFAAIVLDIMMPGMSGFELARLIKQRKRTQDVPILFLTAHLLDEQDVLRGYHTGAVDYLTKPINPVVLRSKIAVFVDLFRKTRALAAANEALQHEIAEREKTQEELRRANRDLETRVQERTAALQEAGRRKDEFLAGLAQELRNPLAALRTAVGVLRLKTADLPDAQKPQNVIDRQAQQMTRLIDDLLDVSRITRDKLTLYPVRVELAKLVADAVETSHPIIEQRRHTLRLSLPPDPIFLEADGVRIAQVFANLLNNAAKYTEPGGDIRLTAERAGDDVLVRVTDTGIGIDPELLPRIFELFVQVDEIQERSHGGLGIGLTLARRLVEMHGGQIEARSDGPGRGSEFLVRLPAIKATSGQVEPTAGAHHERPVPNHSLRILIVDDNRDAAEMLNVMLSNWGHHTRVAYDGPQALEVAGGFLPHVVLLDIGLPEVDGYEVARRLREQPWGRHAILTAVTGWGQEADKQRSVAAGFNHHIVKPVEPGRLRRFLAEMSLSGRPTL